MMHFDELVPAQASALVPHADRLRLAVAAYLARFTGTSRDHASSDLRCYLAWCAKRGLDPFLARRPHLELYIRWMQEVRRFKPSTVSRRVSVVAGFYRTCVIDGVFADGEVARHIPHVWDIATPEAVLAARERECAAAVRRILADLADSPGVTRAADLATKAATSAPTEGRAMYAGLRTLPIPGEPVARLWHAANLLREHRGDGHGAALVSEGIGGLESHALYAVSQGMPAEKFGRIHHLPAATLAAVADRMRGRGLIDDAGRITDTGRETRERIEALTDDLAAPPYDILTPTELDQLIAELEPLAAALAAAGPE